MKHLLVLRDQLTREVGPLAAADPGSTVVVMVESNAIASGMRHHKQKLVLALSAMRHFARGLEADGFRVIYHSAPDLETGIGEHLRQSGAPELVVMRPTDFGVEDRIRAAAESGNAKLRVVPNELWLTDEDEFDTWAENRSTLRLEHFYRAARKRRGWLMEDGAPLGDRWNFDADNRRVPEAGHAYPSAPRFEPDELTRAIVAEVEARWPEHFGSTSTFAWPVTRAEALVALDDFLRHRLSLFGPYEDAMVEGEPVLYHSLLSGPLNLGLLHAREVCERAMTFAADPKNEVPLQSIEGFIRQILGWREFIRHIYRTQMPGLREANSLGHDLPLPSLYWDANTDLRCLAETIGQLHETGHTHHIQRLMVLGNLALISRVDPRELNDWFLATHIDALDWVVTPNVMGMSQYADLGSFTSKPYAASGNYVNRMSDYCKKCRFNPRKTVEPDACPLNALYWDFIDHHADRWRANPRTSLMVKNWEGRDPAVKADILDRAERLRSGLARHT